MHTRNLLRTLPRYLLAAALAAGVATTGLYAVDNVPPGLFELDGNTVDVGATPGDDWDGLFLDPTDPAGNSAAFTGILADPAPASIFTGGGSKDVEDVTEWLHKDGSVPDKDDITNAYAAAYTVPVGQGDSLNDPGDLIIYFGLDRFANDGDAFAGFWFFQDEVTLNGGPSKGGTKFTGQHVVGDLLVLVEYPQGANAVPEIKVYKWVASGGDVAENLEQIFSASAKCGIGGDKLACAITNVGDLPGAPEWPYVNKDEFAGIPFESFFEGGINVSKLLGGDVPCFSSFLAETRSSRSETAQLKDFVLGDFDLCAIEVTKECTAEVSNEGDKILVGFDGVVKNSGGLALNDVTVTDDNGTPNDTSDDIVVFGGVGITLQPGEEQPYSGSYETTATPPLSDTVTAVGHRNGTTVTDEATAECELLIESNLAVTKTCEAAINAEGTGIDVTFSGTVTNTGDDKLTGVKVVDDNGTAADTSDDVTFNLGDLAPGGSAGYNGGFGVSGSDSSTDHVTASATGVLTGSPVEATAQDSCDVIVNPAIAVTKQCTGADINEAGTGILASFAGTVTNIGNVALLGVTVVDDQVGLVLGPIDLAPLASADYSGSYSASGFSATDHVVASGTDALTQTTQEDTAEATCAPDVEAAIDVTKQCTDAAAFGQAILFEGTVTNTGNIALLGVVVEDDQVGGTVLGPIDLAPGDSADYNGSYTPTLAGPSTNTVVATATGADGSAQSDTDNATCEVPPPPDFEGCTPGFWKNSPGSWVVYSPSQTVDSVFTLPNGVLANQLGDDTLLEALGYSPSSDNLVGAAQILLRAAVASLLNAAHPDVDFPRTDAEIKAAVNAALATKERADILALATALDNDNNLGCDLPNDDSF